MSSLQELAENLNIGYEEEVKRDTGSLKITGFNFPDNAVFDPLAKIWSSVRKRIAEKYGVHVTGLFRYKEAVIECSFLLNYGMITTNNPAEIDLIQDRFMHTFSGQMALFENTIEAFLLDFDDGYLAYVKYVDDANPIEEGECERIFNKFLKKIRIKTLEDEKSKKEFKERLEILKQHL